MSLVVGALPQINSRIRHPCSYGYSKVVHLLLTNLILYTRNTYTAITPVPLELRYKSITADFDLLLLLVPLEQHSIWYVGRITIRTLPLAQSATRKDANSIIVRIDCLATWTNIVINSLLRAPLHPSIRLPQDLLPRGPHHRRPLVDQRQQSGERQRQTEQTRSQMHDLQAQEQQEQGEAAVLC